MQPLMINFHFLAQRTNRFVLLRLKLQLEQSTLRGVPTESPKHTKTSKSFQAVTFSLLKPLFYSVTVVAKCSAEVNRIQFLVTSLSMSSDENNNRKHEQAEDQGEGGNKEINYCWYSEVSRCKIFFLYTKSLSCIFNRRNIEKKEKKSRSRARCFRRGIYFLDSSLWDS